MVHLKNLPALLVVLGVALLLKYSIYNINNLYKNVKKYQHFNMLA